MNLHTRVGYSTASRSHEASDTRQPSGLRHLNVERKISSKKALNKPCTFTRSFAPVPDMELGENIRQAILAGVCWIR